jgi:hypothetical protein
VKLQPLSLSTILAAALFIASPAAFAGTPVSASGPTMDAAMDAATKAVEDDARKSGTCVSTYPSIKTCKQNPDGTWVCTGVRANHKGSCK